MKRFCSVVTTVVATLLAARGGGAVAAAVETQNQVRVGMARGPISICARAAGWTEHDPLHAGVLWIEAAEGPVAVFGVDLVGLAGDRVAAVKTEIGKRTGVSPDRMLINFSHTHSRSPELDDACFAERLAGILEAARTRAAAATVSHARVDTGARYCVNRRLALGRGLGKITINFRRGTVIDEKSRRLDVRGQVVDLFRHGANILSPQYQENGLGPDAGPDKPSPKAGAFLDRLPGKMLLDPATDARLDVLMFRGAGGADDGGRANAAAVLGAVIRFPCHPVTFGGNRKNQISADYPGVLTREISRALGGAPTLFLGGPSGEQAPLFVEYGESEMERIGTGLAKEALAALVGAPAAPVTHTAFRRREESFPVAAHKLNATLDGDKAARSAFETLGRTRFDPLAIKQALEQDIRAGAPSEKRREPMLALPFYRLDLNDISIVTMPGEVFAALTRAIEAPFRKRTILAVGLVDSSDPSYVPGLAEYRLGGYEPAAARLLPGAGDRMVKIARQLIGEARR